MILEEPRCWICGRTKEEEIEMFNTLPTELKESLLADISEDIEVPVCHVCYSLITVVLNKIIQAARKRGEKIF